jgi:putative ABC transport system permease protein
VFAAGEDLPAGGAPIVLISDSYWRRRFSSEMGVLGSRVDVNGRPFTVLGVLPAGFRGLSGNSDLWVLITSARSRSVLTGPGVHQFEMIGRLRPGISTAQAKDAVRDAGRLVDERHRDTDGGRWGAAAYTLSEKRVDPALRRSVATLGVAAVVGLGGAMVAARALRTLLYGVAPFDPWAYGISAGVLALAAVAATLIPALRATRVNPLEALRAE